MELSLYQASILAPSWEVPLLNLANQCAVRQKNTPLAGGAEPCQPLYRAVLQRNPTYGYAHYRYADLLYDQATRTPLAQIEQIESLCRQYGQALHLMRPTLRYNSWYRKAEAQAYTRCLGLATDYAQARLLKPETDTQWRLMGLGLFKNLGAEGWTAASKLISRDLKEKAVGLDKYKALARGLELANLPRASEDVLREYLSISPSDPKAWQELVRTMLRQKKIFTGLEVVAVISQAQMHARFSPEEMLFLASAARQAGQVEMALEILRAAIVADPTAPNAFINLGDCLLGAGRPKEAIRAYGQAVALSPNLPEYHVYLGLAYAKDKQYEAAVQEIQRALDLNPHDKKAKAALNKLGIY
ncbi:MAG: tetratricopeptide repeat protein [Proteobacteria bacterium]|nr:tetratricopeptide repeat protein [Pseudomonadota bacterium]MBU1452599.1 tetratricopeptide repeat protein [Pseudomonadota bacterium]MBU2467910.1 tetratricopeptide repeat protein [Pseudomonadota bacterium]MBU2519334.1 tetratricopeptide repeat protein [Pseudomonadota bacterium]